MADIAWFYPSTQKYVLGSRPQSTMWNKRISKNLLLYFFYYDWIIIIYKFYFLSRFINALFRVLRTLKNLKNLKMSGIPIFVRKNLKNLKMSGKWHALTSQKIYLYIIFYLVHDYAFCQILVIHWLLQLVWTCARNVIWGHLKTVKIQNFLTIFIR